MLLYSSEKYDGPPIDLAKANATKCYMSHKENEQILKLFLKKGTRIEKVEASKELAICERKQAYWMRHPNFDQEEAVRQCAVLNKNWTEK